ncbi:hypothetical protein GWK47_014956 [Chionoecetes opilio]|uniref:Uncharacterized protein n=1 Tax=Chionoecetes opilio TaxID=41210 RepID=A0A8J5CKT3_CHIOP|nr:hypothetical protein GWK47_014956 [Chionoecetes opilio]
METPGGQKGFGLAFTTEEQVELEEAHFGLCPCRSGLVCTSGTCQLSGPDPSNQGQIAPDHSASKHMSNYCSSEY